MPDRKYTHSFGELCDRMFICQLKELLIPEHREVYTQQIKDIVHDLDMICKEKGLGIGGNFILAVGNNMLMNRIIWENESNIRNNISTGNDLTLTHSINFLRVQAYSMTSELVGDRGEYKKDVTLPHKDWIPSLFEEKKAPE
jgi:hypothetical protein